MIKMLITTMQIVQMKKTITISENDLIDSKRDRILRLREGLEGVNFGKTEVKLKMETK